MVTSLGHNPLTDHIIAEPDTEAEEVDQDPGGQDQAASEEFPDRREVQISLQLLSVNCRGGAARRVPSSKAFALLCLHSTLHAQS